VPEAPINDAPFRLIAADVELGPGVIVHSFTNLYGCRVGAGTRIGAFVEIQAGATVGASCKISSHTFVCAGVQIADEVFVGHGVMFINDKRPRATTDAGAPQQAGDWELQSTTVGYRASLGSGAVILGGVTIGEGALVGAGAVVTKSVPPFATVVGNPARAISRPASRWPSRGE
jgi:UDP-2-acetamido-3-amino-2,3-dideoxy-glucuronate N-acetyltransferase